MNPLPNSVRATSPHNSPPISHLQIQRCISISHSFIIQQLKVQKHMRFIALVENCFNTWRHHVITCDCEKYHPPPKSSVIWPKTSSPRKTKPPTIHLPNITPKCNRCWLKGQKGPLSLFSLIFAEKLC